MKKKFISPFFQGKNLQSGGINAGMLYILVIMAAITTFSFLMMGGNLPIAPSSTTKGPSNPGDQEIVFEQVPGPEKENLQLQTFTVKNVCQSKIAVDFLIDVSGSMQFGNKQNEEKAALRAFTGKMVDDSVIGIQIFSQPGNIREVVPLSYYKDVKQQVKNTISTLPAAGGTYTRDALSLAYEKLAAAINQNKFPGYKYSLVFLTDGVPEAVVPLPYDDSKCLKIVPDATLGQRCFAKIQDPRNPPNVGVQIKNLGVEIYSIGITSDGSSDRELQPYLEDLLKDVASPPLSEHYYTSLNGADLTRILEKVFTNICSQ